MRSARVLAGLLVLAWTTARPVPAGPAESRSAFARLLASVEPRRGIAHRWLAVVPLVRPGAGASVVAGDPEPRVDGVSWTPSPQPREPGRVTLRAGPAGAGLLPSGTLLGGLPDERLTLVPALLPDGEPRLLPSVPVATLRPAPGAPGPPGGEAVRLPPIEFRRSAFAGASPEDLRALLAVEAFLAGRDPTVERVPLSELEACLPDRVGPAFAAMEPLPEAYGGDVVGHAVFLGNRLVELEVAQSPGTYRSVLAQERRAIAFSSVLWEEGHGVGGPLVPEIDWPATVEETTRVLRVLRDASIRRATEAEAGPGAGEASRVRAAIRPGLSPVDVGWLLSDAAGRAVWFEGWPEPMSEPLPSPTRASGRVAGGDEPGGRAGGGAGVPYLERRILFLGERNESGAFTKEIQRLEQLLRELKRRRGE